MDGAAAWPFTSNDKTRVRLRGVGARAIHVKDLDEDITPYIFNNTPLVLTVGYRCLEMGYKVIWPSGQSPFFTRSDGMIIHLMVEHYLCLPHTG